MSLKRTSKQAFTETSVPGVYTVTQHTLSLHEKQAIGDFLLFVGRNAIAFLNPEAAHGEGAMRRAAREPLRLREFLAQPHPITSEGTRSALRFLTFLANDENMRKTNDFADPKSTFFSGSNADNILHDRMSGWSRTQCPHRHPLDRLQHNRTEWDDVHAIVNLAIYLPLREVIFAAIQNMSQHYHPRSLVRRSYDVPAPERERRELISELQYSAGQVWQTLFTHPIFMEFWSGVRQLHGPDALRAEADMLRRSDGDDALLMQHLDVFLQLYTQPDELDDP
jgi:hypothetical protein